MLFHPVAYYLRHAAEALERAIRERAAGRPCHPPLSTAAAYLRVAIKARAWAADDWATFHRF
jgi:hypothetical protein